MAFHTKVIYKMNLAAFDPFPRNSLQQILGSVAIQENFLNPSLVCCLFIVHHKKMVGMWP